MPENPWLRSAVVQQPAAVTAPADAGASSGKVTAPQVGVSVPDLADRLPLRNTGRQATIWWLGVTGGAGESTLAGLARGSRAASHAWPVPDERGAVARVALVARTNYSGLSSAQRAAIEWASGVLGETVRVEGLVLIPDAPGRLPRELRHLAEVVSGGVPRTWTLPWVDAWRFGPVDPAVELPAAFHALLADLHLNTITA
ncbi:hypothetical protein BH09ACT5_BH09ACT5_24350 [soil metagenome]